MWWSTHPFAPFNCLQTKQHNDYTVNNMSSIILLWSRVYTITSSLDNGNIFVTANNISPSYRVMEVLFHTRNLDYCIYLKIGKSVIFIFYVLFWKGHIKTFTLYFCLE